jgi:hypothetical protein
MLLALLVLIAGNAQAFSQPALKTTALVYVMLSSRDDMNNFASTGLPMYTLLEGAVLTGVNQTGEQLLRAAGLSFQVVDPDIRGDSYYLVEISSNHYTPEFSSNEQVLLSIGNSVLLRMNPSQANTFTQAGAELRAITLTPKPLPSFQSEGNFPDIVYSDPIIQGMIDQVTQAQIYQYVRELVGELPVWVDGKCIPSRHVIPIVEH